MFNSRDVQKQQLYRILSMYITRNKRALILIVRQYKRKSQLPNGVSNEQWQSAHDFAMASELMWHAPAAWA